MNSQTLLLLKSFDLATTLAISIMAVVLVGIIILELFLNHVSQREKALAKNFIFLICLLEIALMLDFLANTASHLIYLYGVEIMVAVTAIARGVFVLVRFSGLLERKLLVGAIIFGALAILGILGTWLLDSNILRIIGNVAANGVFIFLYFLVIKFMLKLKK